jgi:hypothetical protein
MRVWRFSRLVGVALLALLLAACGGNDTQPGANGDEPASGQNASGTADDTFSVQVTGATEITMPPGNAYFLYYAADPVPGAGRTIPAYYHLLFERIVGGKLYQVNIDFDADTEPGTFALDGDILGLFDEPTAEFIEMELEGDIMEREFFDYFENLQGTLTIDSLGDSASGSFEFTADAIEYTDDGGTIRTVSVQGTFTNVPLIRDDE